MALMALQGMRFYAHHGYYEEERIIGNNFVLDVLVSVSAAGASKTDELYPKEKEKKVDRYAKQKEEHPPTVNYETVYLLCKGVMDEPSQLLETVVHQVAVSISGYFPQVKGLAVRLRKMSPPLGGRVDSSWLLTTYGKMDLSYLEILKKL